MDSKKIVKAFDYVAENSANIPTEMYNDDAVCFIASRYHVSSPEVVRSFLEQSGNTTHTNEGELSPLCLQNNEMKIIEGLMDKYKSIKSTELKSINLWTEEVF